MQAIFLYIQKVPDMHQIQVNILKNHLPRLIYIIRCFFEHTNLLNTNRVTLLDYFSPTYIPQQDLVLEFMVPSSLLESYESFSKTFKHTPLPPYAPETQVLRIPSSELLKMKNCGTYELAHELLASNPLVKDSAESLSPLWDMVRLRLLWAQGLNTKLSETRELIVELHLLFLQLYLACDNFCSKLVVEQDFLDTVFTEKLDFGEVFNIYFGIFTSDSAKLQKEIILAIETLLCTDTPAEQDECFNSVKAHDELIMSMVQDVLSAKNLVSEGMQVESSSIEFLPRLLSVQTASDREFASNLLRVCARETFIVLLSRNNVMAGVISAITRALQMPLVSGMFMLDPEVYRSAIQLIGRLARKDELQREYNLLDEILSATTGFLQLKQYKYDGSEIPHKSLDAIAA